MIIASIFLPFLSSLVLLFFGRFLGYKGGVLVSIFSLFTSFFFALLIFIKFILNLNINSISFSLFNWVAYSNFYINFAFHLDALSLTMVLIILTISLLVHIFSIDYLKNDPHVVRFFSFLSLFTFFMLILVSSDNLLQLFIGWEGVGLCSYLLINFWYTRIQANKAALKAMILNRIGDIGLILGICLIFLTFQSVNFSVIFSLTPYFQNTFIFFNDTIQISLVNLIAFFLFIGVVGKSAQIGLHAWLPDAMEGPTPVSALLHSATMVTAGVFLLIRMSPFFEYASDMLFLITIIGALTTFFAATVGLFQNDIKRIIAYSTCSQLGYMVFACGLSNYTTSMFHLTNHAFFKALLFLCSGSIIHALLDEQDIRKMGGLKQLLPITYIAMLIGSLALIGFPFLSGFYSKDVILESAFSLYTSSGLFAYCLGCLAAFCTTFYSFRLIYLVFLTTPNGFRSSYVKLHNESIHIIFALVGLIFPSIFLGFFSKQLFIGLGTTFWKNSIFIHITHFNFIENDFIPFFFRILPFILSLCSIFCVYFLLHKNFNLATTYKLTTPGLFIYKFFNKKWFLDNINNYIFSQTVLKMSESTFLLDRKFYNLSILVIEFVMFLIELYKKMDTDKIIVYFRIIFLVFTLLTVYFIHSEVVSFFFDSIQIWNV